MLPIVIASIFAIIITFISSKFKHKNIATTIVGMVATLIILIITLNSQTYINAFIENSDSIVKGISSIYPLAQYIKDALINYNLMSLLKFVLVSLIPFILFVVIFSKSFKVINSKMSESYKKANYKVKNLEESTQLKALVIQELRRYIATPIYVLNTAIGMVILIAGGVATLFIDGTTLVELLGYPEFKDILPIGILVFCVFTIGLTCTTNSSISLEGNRLWILKSLPIDTNTIFKSKIIMNLIITIPASIVANIFFFIGLRDEVKYLILNLVLSIVFAIVSAVLGLITNLYFPKMEWTNPTSVVKQSASVLITVMGTMILSLALAGVAIGVVNIFNITNVAVILVIVILLLSIVLIFGINILKSKGPKKFNQL